MPDEYNENVDSQNDGTAQDVNLENADTDSEDEGTDDNSEDGEDDSSASDDDDADALKEKNKQLFARAKKAEGFVLKDGKWVKKEKPTTNPVKSEKPTIQKDSNQGTNVADEVQKALDKRDLDALDLPDSVKKEISNYAKLHSVSILAASKSTYITFLKSELEKKARTEEAANGGKRKAQPISNFRDAKPEDFDLTTEQGRKDWDSYKKFLNGK